MVAFKLRGELKGLELDRGKGFGHVIAHLMTFTPEVDVPVPPGIVNLGLGQKVTFNIG